MKVFTTTRSFFNFGKKASKAVLFDGDTQLKIDRYRGQTEDFLQNVSKYEEYLDGTPVNKISPIEGKCTPEGTRRFVEKAMKNDIPQRNFRKPILEDQ